jgi:hypothetical protein
MTGKSVTGSKLRRKHQSFGRFNAPIWCLSPIFTRALLMDDAKIGDRLQIAQQNTNPLAALTAPIWCLSPIFTRALLFRDRN